MTTLFNKALEESKNSTRNLLLGNGFSISYSNKFDYKSLFELSKFNGHHELKKTFDKLSTTNFEEVIRTLQNVSKTLLTGSAYDSDHAQLLEKMAEKMKNNVDNTKKILIETIKSVHPEKQSDLSSNNYLFCRTFLKHFIGKDLISLGKIFSLNYDLLLYWALMSDRDQRHSIVFCDGFKGKHWFITNENANTQNIFYLHGALHLFERENFTEKVTYSKYDPLIQQINELISNDLYPLFITEGNTSNKLTGIYQSEYLNHAYIELQKIRGFLFIVGSSFGEQDKHIWNAIKKNSHIKKIFIGLHQNDEATIRIRANELFPHKERDFFNISEISLWD